jgi:hypothetical protein
MFTEFDFSFNGGTATLGSGNRTQQAMIFQPILPIKLTDRFKMITRPTLPVIIAADIPQGRGTGAFTNFDSFGGLGDFSLPLMFAQQAPLFKLGSGGVVGALGPPFIFPTSTSDEFGDQQYQVGLAGLALWKNSKFTVGVFPQRWWGVGYRSSSQPRNFVQAMQNPKVSHGDVLYIFYYE